MEKANIHIQNSRVHIRDVPVKGVIRHSTGQQVLEHPPSMSRPSVSKFQAVCACFRKRFRRKASKQKGQSREDAAWIILQTAHCMKVRVHPSELSSWAKIVHWLRGPKAAAIVEMFGELTVPHFTWDVCGQAWTEHDVQCCQAGLQKDGPPNKRFGLDDLHMFRTARSCRRFAKERGGHRRAVAAAIAARNRGLGSKAPD